MQSQETVSNLTYCLPNPNLAPELIGTEPIGDRIVRLSDYRDRVVLLTFWTVNCFASRHLLHVLNRMQRTYEADGLQIVGIHSPQTPEERKLYRVISAVKDLGIEFPVVADQSGRLARAYHLPTWPSLYLIDRKGEIRAIQAGTSGISEMEMRLTRLLKK